MKWKKFKQEQSKLIAVSGLPLDYIEKENIWIDFLMHGYIDHHKDSVGFSIDDMTKNENYNFKKLIDIYFESGFEFFIPMALTRRLHFSGGVVVVYWVIDFMSDGTAPKSETA